MDYAITALLVSIIGLAIAGAIGSMLVRLGLALLKAACGIAVLAGLTLIIVLSNH